MGNGFDDGQFFQSYLSVFVYPRHGGFFPLIRGKHSVHSVNKIINTTQLFLDVYTGEKDIFVRPEKVWNRNSDTMFLPHTYEPSTGKFRPVTDGVKSSRFYHTLGKLRRATDERYIDSWDRFFNTAKIKLENGFDLSDDCEIMRNIMMTRDRKMRQKENIVYTTNKPSVFPTPSIFLHTIIPAV